MRSTIMLQGTVLAVVVFLAVLFFSPHGFAIAWAEGWVAALLTMIVYAAIAWHRHERRN